MVVRDDADALSIDKVNRHPQSSGLRKVSLIGVPVYDANGCVAAALSISGPTARMTKMHLSRERQPKVCRVAIAISPQRGHRGGSR